tara:strand:+ start:1441 stop:1674 length:234 start_codon:yes stop_codon:yes gene_type:complete
MNRSKAPVVALVSFVIGCMAAPLAVQRSTAQSTNTWQVHCEPVSSAADMNEFGNTMGAAGWELTTQSEGVMCFKRRM